MKLLFNFASRSRPEKFFTCLDNIYINSRTTDFLILVSLDEDDKTMCNEIVIERLKLYPEVYPIWGRSENKIHAVNRSMKFAPQEWDIVINTSDDMIFTHQGFDETICEDMKENFPDLDGVLHYNDGNQKSNCMTMSIMGKKYFERTNYIYHPSYENLFCDNEAKDVAEQLGKIKYMGDEKIIFRHYHPAFGLAPMDAQYLKSESKEAWAKDEANYNERKANGFK